MPINVAYNPDFVLGGQVAHEAGKGQFLQKQDQFKYQRLDADRRAELAEAHFEEGQDQFQEQLGYRYYASRLQNQQFQQQLGQRAYQHDANRELQRERDQQQSDRQSEAIQAGQVMAGRRDLSGIRRQQENRQYGLAIQEFSRLEQARTDLTPEQYQQAKGQWVKKHGNHPVFAGEYPSDLPATPGSPEFSLEMAQDQFAGFGEYGDEQLFRPEDILMFGQMDGDQFVWDKDGKKMALGMRTDLIKTKQAEKQAKLEAAVKLKKDAATKRKAELDAVAAERKAEATRLRGLEEKQRKERDAASSKKANDPFFFLISTHFL